MATGLDTVLLLGSVDRTIWVFHGRLALDHHQDPSSKNRSDGNLLVKGVKCVTVSWIASSNMRNDLGTNFQEWPVEVWTNKVEDRDYRQNTLLRVSIATVI